MSGPESVASRECGRRLVALIARVQDAPLRHRLIRAIGQIGYDDASALDVLEAALAQYTAASSAYLALASLGGEQAAWVVIRRVKKIIEQRVDKPELDAALAALARLGKLPAVASIERVPRSPLNIQRERSLLKILCTNPIGGFNDLVLSALDSADFQTVMLGLAASRLNHDDAIWTRVEVLAGVADPCIAGRAVHSICHGAGVKQHKRLLEQLCASEEAQSLMLTVLRNLEPAEAADYQAIIAYVDERLAKRDGAFAGPEIFAAATDLRDNLLFAAARRSSASAPGTNQQTARHIIDTDRELATRIKGFHRFNEVVKSTLRNAELTHSHPELFDHRVDKSTMVVEYVKSIDLLLQETIGGQIFAARTVSSIQMQSRVVELQLDDESLPAGQWMKELQIAAPFSADSFPSHKMVSMGRTILSGKFWHTPHRIVDGPRAWAILLLVFGREFTHRSTPKAPLLRVRATTNEQICRTAFRLNELQDIRNEAAHRGTMLRTSEVEQIRSRSFEVLAELDALLF